MEGQLELAAECCPGKAEAVNLETAWPSEGAANGKAVPGGEEQSVAIKAILESVGERSVFLALAMMSGSSRGSMGLSSIGVQ